MEAENRGIDQVVFDYIIDAYAKSSFYQLLGLRVRSLAPGKAEIMAETDIKHSNAQGMVHGGLFMTAADSAMGNAIRTLGIKAVTVDCSISFLAPAQFGKDIMAAGEIIKSGRQIFFTEAKVFSEGKLLATAKASFYKVGIIGEEV